MDYLTTARHDAHQTLDVMVVGEALIDVVTTSHDKVEHPGGSPANVAYGLGRLGVTTGLLTAIAPDARGTSIENHLRSAGVILLPGSKSLTRTASATATLGPDGSAQYDFDISWDLATDSPGLLPKNSAHRIHRHFPEPRCRRREIPARTGPQALHDHLRPEHQASPARQPHRSESHLRRARAPDRRRQTQRRGRPLALPRKKAWTKPPPTSSVWAPDLPSSPRAPKAHNSPPPPLASAFPP